LRATEGEVSASAKSVGLVMCQDIAQVRGTCLRREAKKGVGDLKRAVKQKPVERCPSRDEG
jgi:hypothetical protein